MNLWPGAKKPTWKIKKTMWNWIGTNWSRRNLLSSQRSTTIATRKFILRWSREISGKWKNCRNLVMCDFSRLNNITRTPKSTNSTKKISNFWKSCSPKKSSRISPNSRLIGSNFSRISKRPLSTSTPQRTPISGNWTRKSNFRRKLWKKSAGIGSADVKRSADR